MARLPVGKNHSAWTKLANELREPEFVLARRLDVGIRDAEITAPGNFQDLGGKCGFFSARFGSAARAHFAGSEVENASLVAFLRHFEKGAAAGKFNVVGMGSDCQDIKFHRGPLRETGGL